MASVTDDQPIRQDDAGASDPIPAAVIDVGTTSIRMAIAEIHSDGSVRTLEALSQAVNLGKDAFTRGSIEKSTIEDCVRVLKIYRRILDDYRIVQRDRIRVVATSAVREAQNRLSFVDRIYSATGFEVEPIDEAEVNRITYLGVQPFLAAEPTLASATTIIIEVGGGSTEVLAVKGGDVLFAHSYRLGSLRLRKMLEAYHAPAGRVRPIMESQVDRTVQEIAGSAPHDGAIEMVALGGDVRFAAAQLLDEWNPDELARLPLDALESFTDHLLELSDDEIVQRYHLSFPDAETVGPALLADVRLARALGIDRLLVTKFTLRDGLLREMAVRDAWTEEFRNQIVRSALSLGHKFQLDEDHGRHVAMLARKLYHALQDEHQLEPRYELILHIAALLHEIGLFISNVGHHKHSMYLIQNSELFGLSKRDVLLVSLVARYHRRASPKPNHQGYAALDREQRVAVSKMAAMLRVADALDRAHNQRIQDFTCRREGNRFVVTIPGVEDLSLEQLALKQKGPLFEEIFGMPVLLRPGRP